MLLQCNFRKRQHKNGFMLAVFRPAASLSILSQTFSKPRPFRNLKTFLFITFTQKLDSKRLNRGHGQQSCCSAMSILNKPSLYFQD